MKVNKKSSVKVKKVSLTFFETQIIEVLRLNLSRHFGEDVTLAQIDLSSFPPKDISNNSCLAMIGMKEKKVTIRVIFFTEKIEASRDKNEARTAWPEVTAELTTWSNPFMSASGWRPQKIACEFLNVELPDGTTAYVDTAIKEGAKEFDFARKFGTSVFGNAWNAQDESEGRILAKP